MERLCKCLAYNNGVVNRDNNGKKYPFMPYGLKTFHNNNNNNYLTVFYKCSDFVKNWCSSSDYV